MCRRWLLSGRFEQCQPSCSSRMGSRLTRLLEQTRRIWRRNATITQQINRRAHLFVIALLWIICEHISQIVHQRISSLSFIMVIHWQREIENLAFCWAVFFAVCVCVRKGYYSCSTFLDSQFVFLFWFCFTFMLLSLRLCSNIFCVAYRGIDLHASKHVSSSPSRCHICWEENWPTLHLLEWFEPWRYGNR